MRLVHARHVAWRQIGEEFVVLDLADKLMFGFNATAGQIWSMLDNPREIHALTSLEDDAMKRKVCRFIDELMKRGLLVKTGDDAIPCKWPYLTEGPAISWRESMQHVAATCAFLPSQNPLCNQVPFS